MREKVAELDRIPLSLSGRKWQEGPGGHGGNTDQVGFLWSGNISIILPHFTFGLLGHAVHEGIIVNKSLPSINITQTVTDNIDTDMCTITL